MRLAGYERINPLGTVDAEWMVTENGMLQGDVLR